MAKAKKVGGRPKIAMKDRRTVILTVRLKKSEHRRLIGEAAEAGCKPATYLRNCWLGGEEGDES